MTSFLFATSILLLLILEGYIIATYLLPTEPQKLRISLGLPLGALMAFCVIFLFTIINIPLNATSIIGTHAAVVVIPFFLMRPTQKRAPENDRHTFHTHFSRSLFSVSTAIIVFVSIYATAHALLLPTLHYDSAVNWNMRSKISWHKQHLILDDQEERIAKPHYPFLYHSLQITAMQLQPTWKEPIANGIHLALTLFSFLSLFILMRLLRGRIVSTVFVATILGIPLLSLHTGQSYADLPLIQFALLSLLSLALFVEKRESTWLTLSSLFIIATVYTKSDGLFFCFVPWSLLVLHQWLLDEEKRQAINYHAVPTLLAVLLWPAFALSKGLALTPHGTDDITLTFSWDAIPVIMKALFVDGSFGILWYIIVFLLLLAIRGKRVHSTLLWGLLSFLFYLGVYIFTSNSAYLFLRQSFDRQMLLPAALLIASFALIYGQKAESKA